VYSSFGLVHFGGLAGQCFIRTHFPSAFLTYPSLQKHPATHTIGQIPLPFWLSQVLTHPAAGPQSVYSSLGLVHFGGLAGQCFSKIHLPSAFLTYPSLQKHPETQILGQGPPSGLSQVLTHPSAGPHRLYSSFGFGHFLDGPSVGVGTSGLTGKHFFFASVWAATATINKIVRNFMLS